MFRPATFGLIPTPEMVQIHQNLTSPPSPSRWLVSSKGELEVLTLTITGSGLQLSLRGHAVEIPPVLLESSARWLALDPSGYPIALGTPEIAWHKREIPRGVLGEVSKIREELYELEDALEQDAKVMVLVEAADIVGAVGAFAKKAFNFSLEDLVKMAEITARARSANEQSQ